MDMIHEGKRCPKCGAISCFKCAATLGKERTGAYTPVCPECDISLKDVRDL